MALSLDSAVREQVEELIEELDRCILVAVDDLLLGNYRDGSAMIERAVAARYSILAAFPPPLADYYEMFRHCEMLAALANRWSTLEESASRQEVIDDLQRTMLEVEGLPHLYPANVTRPLTESLKWLRETIQGLQAQKPSSDLPAATTPERLKKIFLQNVAPDEPLEQYFSYLDRMDAGLVNALLELEKSQPDTDEAIEYLELARQNKELFLQRMRAHEKARLLPSQVRQASQSPLSSNNR